jgi:hypothetical protein
MALVPFCFGAAILTWSRRIAICRLHFAPLGQPLPVIPRFADVAYVDPATGDQSGVRQTPDTFFRNEYDLAVRETEPNAAARLKSYIPTGNSRTTIRLGAPDIEMLKYFRQIFPSEASARHRLYIASRDAAQLRTDLAPLCRLLIARSLYPQRHTKKTKRTAGEEGAKQDAKPNHLLTYKVHLTLTASWFFLLSIGQLLLIANWPVPSHKVLGGVQALTFLMWGIFALYYNGRAAREWKKWIQASSIRPLGNLPLFLYVPSNSADAKWEELDPSDFKWKLDEFVMDTSTAFQIAAGTFVSVGLIIVAKMI